MQGLGSGFSDCLQDLWSFGSGENGERDQKFFARYRVLGWGGG